MNVNLSNNVDMVLLADDDEDDRMLFANAIEELTFSVKLVSVNDGEALMKWLNDAQFLPGIVFLDMNMPCKNGAECLAEIKYTERLKNIPIVIISTSLDENLIQMLHKSGALFYIKKPNLYSHLKILIGSVIELVRKGNFTAPTLEKFILTVENRSH